MKIPQTETSIALRTDRFKTYVSLGNADMVKALLPYMRREEKTAGCSLAVGKNYVEIVKLLLEDGCDPNYNDGELIRDATLNNSPGVVQALVDSGMNREHMDFIVFYTSQSPDWIRYNSILLILIKAGADWCALGERLCSDKEMIELKAMNPDKVLEKVIKMIVARSIRDELSA